MSTDSIGDSSCSTAVCDFRNLNQIKSQVECDGFAVVESVFSDEQVDDLRAAIEALPERQEVRRKSEVYGVRNLLDLSSEVRELAAHPNSRKVVTSVLGDQAFAVRATFFDKVPNANWNLRFHQDGVIAVKNKCEVDGFRAWAEKAGVWQVRPPEKILSQMLAIRIHLDDCLAENGPLRVLKGSHFRYWERDDITECRERFPEVTCEVEKGGMLVMRPLVMHASSAATVPKHRRVIHIEYTNTMLQRVFSGGTKLPEPPSLCQKQR